MNFTYGLGRHSAVPETYFRKLEAHRGLPLYYLGERGHANVTYDWMEQKFPDNSAIKTFYFTGGASHNPEPQILYNSGGNIVLLQGNKNWNWGEQTKLEYLNVSDTKVKEDIYSWTFEGDYADTSPLILATVVPRLLYTSGTPDSLYIHFTHKQLDSVVTKTYFGSNVVTSKDAYEYNDGTLLFKKTETSGDSKIHKTENTYIHDVVGLAVADSMKKRNMRGQIAQSSVKDNSNNGYSSTITTWRIVTHSSKNKFLPDKEFRWRNNTTAAAIPSFNWTTPSETNGWILTQTFDQYDQHGNLTSVKDANNITTSIFWDGTATLIDSIKTRSNSSLVPLTTKYGYDPNTFRLTSMTDPNGQKTQYKYDPLQRLIEVVMPDKRTAFDYAYYYSRTANSDTFAAADPNYVKTRSMSGPGFFEPFEYTDSPANHGWGVHIGGGNGTMSTVYDNVLQSQVMRVDVNPGVYNEDYAVKYPATGDLGLSSTHLWVKVKNAIGSSSFRVAVIYGGLEYVLVYYFDNGTNWYNSVNRTVYIYVGATFKDGNWHTLERDLEQDFKMANLPANYQYTRRVVARGEYDLDDIQLLDHPVTTITFADGLGRDIQTLQYDKAGAIKVGTYYDALDRVTKVTKPFFTANKNFTLAAIDSANTYYASNYPVYYNNASSQVYHTSPYAFSETEYYPDPLNRLRYQYFPGALFSKLGPVKKYVKYYYGANAANELSMPANTAFETRIFDENGVQTEIFTDSFGNKVGMRSDSSGADNSGTSSKLATAFQYDILNNLTKVAPPRAFNLNNNNTVNWSSPFCTILTYNTLSQLTSRKTPDSGLDSMYYDKKGNLRFVKDSKGAAGNYFIYYKYDNLGRKIEEGTMTPASGNFNQSNADTATYPATGNAFKVKFQYDSTTYTANAPQRNLRGRLDAIEYISGRYPNVKGYMFFSYDSNGNLEWIEQYIPKSNVADGNGYLVAMINYQYDALGKITKIHFRRTFPPGASADAFYVWYDYDALGRLEKAYTNTADNKPTTANAQYTYWPGAQVRRLVLGGTLQGVDFLYNSRDWLTQINHQNFNSTQDPGGDGGGAGVPNADHFGQIIGYNIQDHLAIGSSDFMAQYNGNIAWTITRTTGNTQPVGTNLTGWIFRYDKANRLTKARWGYYNSVNMTWPKPLRYNLTGRATADSLIEYDRHGNLDLMLRFNENGAATVMDYRYVDYPNTNKLGYISGMAGHTNFNYKYDANGNMTHDKAKLGPNAADSILYDYRNLPVKIQKSVAPAGTVELGYDGKGQRVSKNNLFYVPGADGRVLAVYDDKGTLLYWNIWGLDLIGQRFWKQ